MAPRSVPWTDLTAECGYCKAKPGEPCKMKAANMPSALLEPPWGHPQRQHRPVVDVAPEPEPTPEPDLAPSLFS